MPVNDANGEVVKVTSGDARWGSLKEVCCLAGLLPAAACSCLGADLHACTPADLCAASRVGCISAYRRPQALRQNTRGDEASALSALMSLSDSSRPVVCALHLRASRTI